MIYLNGYSVSPIKFPNGETNVDVYAIDDMYAVQKLELIFEGNDDLVNLMFLKRHLDDHNKRSRLVVSYFPYERMDRSSEDYAFSLKYICEFINFLNFVSVRIMTPHSDVLPALLKRCYISDFTKDNIDKVLCIIGGTPLLFFPDAGAVKRYANVLNRQYAYANKLRDFKSGAIVQYKIAMPDDMGEYDSVLIVDDLCSRGGTFLHAAYEIKLFLGKEIPIYLFVAHCEQNVFTGELLKEDSPIEKIFTSGSMIRNEHKKIINIETMR